LFVNEALKTHFETSATIKLQSLILAEWNMNMPDNIFYVGNYRYRPTDADLKFKTLPIYFDQLDAGDYYTDATDSEVSISGGVDDEDSPQLFTSIEQKRKLLYSLEDCLKPFRPRSGINKPLFFRSNKQYLANSGASLAQDQDTICHLDMINLNTGTHIEKKKVWKGVLQRYQVVSITLTMQYRS
jgi:hypothetical protein